MKTFAMALAGAAVIAVSLSTFALAKGRAGHCGENMYYSIKLHKCLDARNKT